MIAANYSTVRENLKEYCDKVCDNNETLIVTRKADRNVVLMSIERYTELEKAERNALYLAKIEEAFQQLHAGKGTVHELLED